MGALYGRKGQMMFKNILPLITGLALAGTLSQFPEFSQQYTQRVGGAYFELREVADGFRADAAASGKTVKQAVGEYFAADSDFFHDRGRRIEYIMQREEYLANHYSTLTSSSGFGQLIEFAQERDFQLTRDTFGIYKPAVPLTLVGGAHAGLGFLVGFLALRFPALFRRKRRKDRTALA
ncbi:MAG: hypothetical protein ACI9ZD_000544 [Paracoccaceae bacterium]|jgi:hypothetical protein